MSRRHPCPGCGTSVQLHLLACGPCWWRLPGALRTRVNITYRRRHIDPAGHRQAVAAASEWYRQQREASTGV